MSQQQKAVISLTNLAVGNQITKCKLIEEALSQTQYNQVTPTPAEVLPIIAALESAQAKCDLRNYEWIPVRNDLLKQMQVAVRKQCNSVNTIANGDPNYLAFCGFGLSKIPAPHQEPEQGAVKKMVDKGQGTAIFTMKTLKFCSFYELQIEGAGNLNISVSATVAKFKVAEMPMGVILKARVRGVNNKGVGLWSPWVDFSLSLTAPIGGVGDSTND